MSQSQIESKLADIFTGLELGRNISLHEDCNILLWRQ